MPKVWIRGIKNPKGSGLVDGNSWIESYCCDSFQRLWKEYNIRPDVQLSKDRHELINNKKLLLSIPTEACLYVTFRAGYGQDTTKHIKWETMEDPVRFCPFCGDPVEFVRFGKVWEWAGIDDKQLQTIKLVQHAI